MTTPVYITDPKQPPHHRGNTYSTGYDRPWFGPVDDAERAQKLTEMIGALSVAMAPAGVLGTATDDYATSIQCIIERAQQERRTITEGCK